MRRAILACLTGAALLSAGCMTMSRITSYTMTKKAATAEITLDSRRYTMIVHPKENTILLQRGMGASVGRSFVQGATFGVVETSVPYDRWRSAAQAYVAPVGCTITDVYPLDQNSTWEARFQCPGGVDLFALTLDQRAAVNKGEPLQP